MSLKCLLGFHAYQHGVFGTRICKRCYKIDWHRDALLREVSQSGYCDQQMQLAESLQTDNKSNWEKRGYVFLRPVDDSEVDFSQTVKHIVLEELNQLPVGRLFKRPDQFHAA